MERRCDRGKYCRQRPGKLFLPGLVVLEVKRSFWVTDVNGPEDRCQRGWEETTELNYFLFGRVSPERNYQSDQYRYQPGWYVTGTCTELYKEIREAFPDLI